MNKKPVNNYLSILVGLKERIRQARVRASLKVNAEMLAVYWEIGYTIIQQQKKEGWGTKVIDRLASDLKMEFPDMKGFSSRNIKYMRAFAEAYPDFLKEGTFSNPAGKKPKKSKVQQAAAQLQNTNYRPLIIVQQLAALLPWTHHQLLLDKVKSKDERLFYIRKCVENGWSRNILAEQIDSGLHKRQGKALHNFKSTLPAIETDLAVETFKNPYMFDFLTLSEEMKERDLEQGLIEHLKKFMLELGKGFAYVGRQKNLNVDGDDFFLDLLFYNYHLKRFVIFELKIGDFKPEYAGKLNFYINVVNEQVKMLDDRPTIGVLLCKTPNETIIKYSLEGIDQPMGVADYKLAEVLPKQLKAEMPSVEELKKELREEVEKLQQPLDKKLDKLKAMLKNLKEDEVKETHNELNTVRIFKKVALPLKKVIHRELKKDIAELFNELELTIRTDNNIHISGEEALKYLDGKMGGWCNEFEIGIRLKGFKKAGTWAFECWKDVNFTLQEYKYIISFGRAGQGTVLFQKLYHELPSKNELLSIAEKLIEDILDDITIQVDRIANESRRK